MAYIIFLRGVNLGGHNKIIMAKLRQILKENSFSNVQSYIQSGNIILKSDLTKQVLKEKIHNIILDNFGIQASVFVIKLSELEKIINSNPFKNYELNNLYEKKLNVTFLNKKLVQSDKANIIKNIQNGEQLLIQEKIIYLWFEQGLGKSKLSSSISKINYSTTRNWNTITKIFKLTNKQEV